MSHDARWATGRYPFLHPRSKEQRLLLVRVGREGNTQVLEEVAVVTRTYRSDRALTRKAKRLVGAKYGSFWHLMEAHRKLLNVDL